MVEGRVTPPRILSMKGREKIVMVTAYTYTFAGIVDEAGVDMILVGDSVGMMELGYESTIPVTLDDMKRHVSAVARARPRALIVGDLPFGSYEVSVSDAVYSSMELARAGADSVKLEGGEEYADRVKAIVKAGVPVVGHIGLTPQRLLRLGGIRMTGKGEEARQLIRDGEALQEAGAFSIVLEYVDPDTAKTLTEKLAIPTICIGSGPYCDGQVQVLHDLLGLRREVFPFSIKYGDLREKALEILKRYVDDVRKSKGPFSP
ncbi:MAG: 3-methyl-2-oxobutanoate hydroxymethyltransferase [Desulfurococcales archaeon]|nr:3-methyl-2-oxobutanoate hydroxymethyltransferase [Desulfurococcales archaeon]